MKSYAIVKWRRSPFVPLIRMSSSFLSLSDHELRSLRICNDATSPSDRCPGGVQVRNPDKGCQCECDSVGGECPGNQILNVLCQCQCEKTPICTGSRQQFNAISCECECVPCSEGHSLDTLTCDCIREDSSFLLPMSPSDLNTVSYPE